MPEPDELPSLTRPPREESEEAKLRANLATRARSLAEAEKSLEDAEAKLRNAETECEEAKRQVAAKRSLWVDALGEYLKVSGLTFPEPD